ncbi:hypothetical protein SK128_008909 [Halocaridina rubra]|uniref:Ionotropic glutamate receptor L-glutamate and glycine-binding domain-containing protein n=1 Tax=Halocaridina rubra TaxID=373956 RepID=A0AAN9A5J2_HALRR
MQTWPPHNVMRLEDVKARVAMDGIPTKFPIVGPMAEILTILSESLNFTYKQLRPQDENWGMKDGNGTWSGMVGQVVRKEADLGLGPFGIVHSRFQDTSMTIPLHFDTLGILVGKGSSSIDPWGFVMPLTPAVWSAFFFAYLLVCLVHMICLGIKSPISTWPKHFSTALLLYFKTPLKQGMAGKYEDQNYNAQALVYILRYYSATCLLQ